MDEIQNGHYVFATGVEFPEYEALVDRMVTVVKPEYAYASLEEGRKQPFNRYSPDPKYFFSDVHVCATGLQQRDREVLYAGVRSRGGQAGDSLTKLVTHVVAESTESEKCRVAEQHGIKIVLPHWIDDCMKLGRRLDDSPYLFPDPEILRPDYVQNGRAEGFLSRNTLQQVDLTAAAQPTLFKGKTFYLASDLDLSERSREAMVQLIANAGGECTEDLAKANAYIGQWREGDEYVTASRRGRCMVGTVTWLYWMAANNKWARSTKRLLHYPLVRGGIPEMRNYVISITKYTGTARLYLQELIEAMGGTFTRNLTQRNTHLISADAFGAKWDAAVVWNIHRVNHLWLEESYAAWKVNTVSCPRYSYILSHLPLRGALIGSTQLPYKVLKQFYAEPESAHVSPLPPRRAREIASSALHESMVVETEFQAKLRSRKSHHDLPPLPEEQLAAANRRRKAAGELGPGSAKKQARHSSPADTVARLSSPTSRSSPSRSVEDTVVPLSTPPTDLSAPEDNTKTHDDSGYADDSTVSNAPSELLVIGTGLPDKLRITAAALEGAGVVLTDDPSAATYLCAEKPLRTEKFMRALAHVRGVLTPAYLVDCQANGALIWPIPQKYMLSSPELDAALQNAASLRENHVQLFSGYSFNVTPDVKGGFEVFDRIVRAHGAGPSQLVANARAARFVPSKDNCVVLISSPGGKNASIIKAFNSHDHGDRRPVVLSAEWVLSSVMRMSLDMTDVSGVL